ncbi:MAG: Trm112 family protein [Desulfobulbus sp.]|nr:Trm112 family protein [Desulfobulbus sp.]
MIKKELLDILACPQCKGPVELTADENGIVCRACKLLYAIRDNIPIMLIDEAKPLAETKP